MKYLFVFLLTSLSIVGRAQLPIKDGKVVYEFIDSSLSMPKNLIYDNAKLAVVESFVDANAVIQIDDKEKGELVGKGGTRFTYKFMLTQIQNRATYTIAISCRDNKYRIKIYDITVFTGTAGVPYTAEELVKIDNKPSKKTLEALNEHMAALSNQIKTKIKSPSNTNF